MPDRADAELAALERRIGHAFARPELLRRALTHRSYLNETEELDVRDNERLEFLGDAVIGFLVGQQLFRDLPEAREGELTALRAALVRERALAGFARALGLGPLLRLGKGEDASGGRGRPAVLCDAFEALVGALYLDGGLEAAQALLAPLAAPELARVREERRHRDARSEFQEAVQARWQVTPRYETVGESGPDHDKRFQVRVCVEDRPWGLGEGRSKADAARAAARDALARWRAAPMEGEQAATDVRGA